MTMMTMVAQPLCRSMSRGRKRQQQPFSLLVLVVMVGASMDFLRRSSAEALLTATPRRIMALQSSSSSPDNDFDPFATSPLAYPANGDLRSDGINSSPTPTPTPRQPQLNTPKKPFGIDYYSSVNKQQQQQSSPSSAASVIPAETFDPRISPHEYSTNNINKKQDTTTIIPQTGKSTQPPTRKKVGVLLMDHGSKNPAANQRLHNLAALYQQQQQFQTNHDEHDESVEMIVTAAHMEIATPTIPQALEWLVSQQVDEIICHPYFLSPGRHVTQDIPLIVQQAIIDLNIDSSIPVRTTEPVGSNTLLMMGAIHALVKEHSHVLRQQTQSN